MRLQINKHLKVEATPVSRKILTVNQFICFVLQESGEERIVLGIRISLYHSRKFLGIKWRFGRISSNVNEQHFSHLVCLEMLKTVLIQTKMQRYNYHPPETCYSKYSTFTKAQSMKTVCCEGFFQIDPLLLLLRYSVTFQLREDRLTVLCPLTAHSIIITRVPLSLYLCPTVHWPAPAPIISERRSLVGRLLVVIIQLLSTYRISNAVIM